MGGGERDGAESGCGLSESILAIKTFKVLKTLKVFAPPETRRFYLLTKPDTPHKNGLNAHPTPSA